MTFKPDSRSIKGRLLGVNSTGLAVHSGVNSTLYGYIFRTTADVVQNSTEMAFAALLNTRRTVACGTTVLSTQGGYGMLSLTSGSATAVDVELTHPVAGRYCDIHIDTSASELQLQATSSSIHFASTLEINAADRTTALFATTVVGAGTVLAGGVIRLVGVSTAQWQLVSYQGPAFPSSGERGLQVTIG